MDVPARPQVISLSQVSVQVGMGSVQDDLSTSVNSDSDVLPQGQCLTTEGSSGQVGQGPGWQHWSQRWLPHSNSLEECVTN